MTLPHHKADTLKRLLRGAYQERENQTVGDDWQESTMARIRALTPGNPPMSLPMAIGLLTWRLAPAAGALVILLIVILATTDLPPAAHMYQLMIDDFESSEMVTLLAL